MLESIEGVLDAFAANRYVADRDLAVAVYLALTLPKPLLLEGEAGVGKTEVAKVLASSLNARLIRVQGYEGIDVNAAVYEWNYARQIMAIRSAEAFSQGEPPDLFGAQFLVKRPILQALEAAENERVVLLIDELDRADDEFEAFLLEILSDFQVTIPEIGTITAAVPPVVVITSNRTRELHEALKRRCLYHWIDYPDFGRELWVVQLKAPAASELLARQIVRFVQELRRIDLLKPPGMSETIDWAAGMVALDHAEVTEPAVMETVGLLLKNAEDIELVRNGQLEELVRAARSES